MNSARFVGAVHGADFGAAIADAGDVGEQSTQTEWKLDDPIFALLADLHVATSEAREERGRLLGERFDLNSRTETFLLREREQAHQRRIQEHEKLKEVCAEQLRAIEAIKDKLGELQRELTGARKVTAAAVAVAREAQQRRQSLPRFASRTEIAKCDDALRLADENATKATEAEAPIAQEIQRLTFVDLHRAGEKLKELENQERDLALTISGEAGTNSLGFIVRRR